MPEMTALNQALAPAPAQRTWQVVALAAVVVLGLTMASLVGSVLSVGATWPTNIPITVSFLYMTTTSTVRHATSMPPRGSLTLCSQPVRPFVCYQTCEYRILKTNTPILTQIGTNGPLDKSSSSRMHVMNHNWSATKQHLHP